MVPIAAWCAPVFLLRFARNAKRGWIAHLMIFAAYMAANFIALRGMPLSVFGVIVIPLFRGLAYSLPCAADRRISRRLTGWARVLIFPLAFTTVDWVMSLLPSITSAGSPAYSQYSNQVLMQIVSLTGMWGVTFLIMWFASTINQLWERRFDWRTVRGTVGVYAAVLLATVLFGSIRVDMASPTAKTVEVATVTTGREVQEAAIKGVEWVTFNRLTDPERAAARPLFEATVEQMLARIDTALRGGAKIVGTQESAAFVLEEDTQSVLDRAAALARQYDAYVEVSLWAPTVSKSWPYVHNESILLGPSGSVLWNYEKTHLVSGGENYIVIAGDGRLPVVDTPYGRLSPAICNDMHFPALIRQAGRNGVDILIASYDEMRPFDEHAAAVSRAIENGVSLVRPTMNGVSLVADYQGRVLGSQDYDSSDSGIMVTTIPMHGVRTLYSRIGDVFAYLCVAGFALLQALAIAGVRNPQGQPKGRWHSGRQKGAFCEGGPRGHPLTP